MMRALLAFVLLAMMLPLRAGELWDSLWRNADQRGEALMQRGDAGGAAGVYADPRRKAYAKLQAGDYRGAAQDLAPLRDSDADYNRGNAHAHAGDLQGALEAYDAALKSDPGNRDAKHNRELVERALKQQSSQQKSGGKQSQDGEKDGEQGKGQQGKDQNSQGQNKPGDKGRQGEQGAQGKDGKQGNPARDGTNAGKNIDNNQDDAKYSKQESRNGKQAQAGNAADNGQKPAAQSDAEQARRDAEASLARPEKGEGAGNDANASGAIAATAPRSEQQLAQEQWLRSIPEDPGGLLRRKFMIEHMMRQQKAQQ